MDDSASSNSFRDDDGHFNDGINKVRSWKPALNFLCVTLLIGNFLWKLRISPKLLTS